MMVDYGKLSEFAVQWLTTLDTLARFTQMEIELKKREELAFRAHRALQQFIQMSVGCKETVFLAFLNLRIVHHAGRVHSNMPNS